MRGNLDEAVGSEKRKKVEDNLGKIFNPIRVILINHPLSINHGSRPLGTSVKKIENIFYQGKTDTRTRNKYNK